MLLATALAYLLQDVLEKQTFTVQNKPAAVAPETITIISSFLELGRRKLSDAMIVAAQKMLLNKASKHFIKWIAQFYYFRHLYSAGSACVLTIIA